MLAAAGRPAVAPAVLALLIQMSMLMIMTEAMLAMLLLMTIMGFARPPWGRRTADATAAGSGPNIADVIRFPKNEFFPRRPAMLAAAGRPAVVPAGAADRRHRRYDDHGEVKYDGGGIGTADYDGHAYDYDGDHADDEHHSDPAASEPDSCARRRRCQRGPEGRSPVFPRK